LGTVGVSLSLSPAAYSASRGYLDNYFGGGGKTSVKLLLCGVFLQTRLYNVHHGRLQCYFLDRYYAQCHTMAGRL